MKRSDPKRISYANSTFYILLDAGTGIGPVFLGAVVPALGYRGMYMSVSLFAVVLTVMYLIMVKRSGN